MITAGIPVLEALAELDGNQHWALFVEWLMDSATVIDESWNDEESEVRLRQLQGSSRTVNEITSVIYSAKLRLEGVRANVALEEALTDGDSPVR